MLPELFLKRMEALLADEFPMFLDAIERPAVRAMRINNTKVNKDTAVSAFGDALIPISYAEDGYVFDVDKIGTHPLHHAGGFYVQDPGAMATLHALTVQKGWRVADFCAAPGGKTSQLSAYVGEEGVVLSNEIDHGRCKVLSGNLERLGARNVILTNTDTKTLASWFSSCFDLVLVDAPCSGEGMFRKYDHAQYEWSEEGVKACAERQRGILEDAAKTVKAGGYLLYSTCTFSLEENEKTVDHFLTLHPDFTVESVLPVLHAATADGIAFEGAKHPSLLPLTRRFYPHRALGEGQYIALLRKTNAADTGKILYREPSCTPSREEEKIARAFLKEVLQKDAYEGLFARRTLIKYKDSLFFKPDLPLPPRSVYLPGVCIGTVTKGRLEPHHQLFSAFGQLFARKAELSYDDETVQKYLHGETFETALVNGYAAVLVNGAPLGGIKVVLGVAKNHYPKGLRLK